MSKKLIVIFSIMTLINLATSPIPNTYSVSSSLLYNCSSSSRFADMTLGGRYICTTQGDTAPNIKSSAGTSILDLLSQFSPPKSTKQGTIVALSCYKSKSKCVVFWNAHFQQYTISDSSIQSELVFISSDITTHTGLVLDNTNFVIMGGVIREFEPPQVMRVDTTTPTKFFSGSLARAFGLAQTGRKIESMIVLTFTRWVVLTEIQSRTISITDLTTLLPKDQLQQISQAGREKNKFLTTLEYYIDSTIFALVSDDIKIFKVDRLELLASKDIDVGQGVKAVTSWIQSSDIAILFQDKIEIMRFDVITTVINPIVTTYQLTTIVTDTLAANTVSNIIYDYTIHDILQVKSDGGHTMRFSPGLTCHKNCQTCSQSFSPSSTACSACAPGTIASVDEKFCKKSTTPNPLGGYFFTYTGLRGKSFLVQIDPPEEEPDKTIDPNKIVANNISVIFILIGTILVLTLIIFFGLVSFLNIFKKFCWSSTDLSLLY